MPPAADIFGDEFAEFDPIPKATPVAGFADFGSVPSPPPVSTGTSGFADFGTFEQAAPRGPLPPSATAAIGDFALGDFGALTTAAAPAAPADFALGDFGAPTTAAAPEAPADDGEAEAAAPEKPKLSKEEKAARKAAKAAARAAAEEEERQRLEYEEQRALRLQKLEQQQKASSSSWGGGWGLSSTLSSLSSTLGSPAGGLSSLTAAGGLSSLTQGAEELRKAAARRAEEAAAAFQTPSKAMDDLRGSLAERLQSSVGSLGGMPILGMGTPAATAAGGADAGAQGGAFDEAGGAMRMAELQAELAQAVEAEDYAKAAEIKSQIKQLKARMDAAAAAAAAAAASAASRAAAGTAEAAGGSPATSAVAGGAAAAADPGGASAADVSGRDETSVRGLLASMRMPSAIAKLPSMPGGMGAASWSSLSSVLGSGDGAELGTDVTSEGVEGDAVKKGPLTELERFEKLLSEQK